MRVSKKQLLNELESQYFIIKWDNGYNLYDKTKPAKHMSSGAFVAHIEINNGKYLYQNEKYSNVEDLTNAIENYIVTLPFNHELYDPTYTKSFFTEMCCHEYLTKIGFEKQKGLEAEIGVYEYKNPLLNDNILKIQLDFDKNRDSSAGKVLQFITNYRWVEAPFKDVESAIGAINSVITQNTFILASSALKILGGISNIRSANNIDMKQLHSNLQISVTDMKEKLIEAMEKELALLKQTN